MKLAFVKSDTNSLGIPRSAAKPLDVYFSADIETDGAIPGPFSMLSFALVYAGAFDGVKFYPPRNYNKSFYRELRPISHNFDPEALAVNGLDRNRLMAEGVEAVQAMTEASAWVENVSAGNDAVCVAYPLSFDWSWLYWYFVRYSRKGSPFGFSRCFDIKTAVAVKLGRTIASSGREKIPNYLRPDLHHTHNALDDAIEQAIIFSRIFTESEEE